MANEGWICPKCGRVWAPSVKECRCSEPVSTEMPKTPKPKNPDEFERLRNALALCAGCCKQATPECGTYAFCPIHMRKTVYISNPNLTEYIL